MNKNLKKKILQQKEDCEKTTQKWLERAKENNESLKDKTRSKQRLSVIEDYELREYLYSNQKIFRIHILDFNKILNKWHRSKMPRFNKRE